MLQFLPECSLNLLRYRQDWVETPLAFLPRWKCMERPSTSGLPYTFRRFGAGPIGDVAQSWPQKHIRYMSDATHILVPAGNAVEMGRSPVLYKIPLLSCFLH